MSKRVEARFVTWLVAAALALAAQADAQDSLARVGGGLGCGGPGQGVEVGDYLYLGKYWKNATARYDVAEDSITLSAGNDRKTFSWTAAPSDLKRHFAGVREESQARKATTVRVEIERDPGIEEVDAEVISVIAGE